MKTLKNILNSEMVMMCLIPMLLAGPIIALAHYDSARLSKVAEVAGGHAHQSASAATR